MERTEDSMTSGRKGIILAGGLGTRMHPLTTVTSKQLLPVYDKPMIYYSLSTLLLMGIRDIVLISSSQALPNFRELLSDGSQWGITLRYVEQVNPNGIAEALILAEHHIANQKCVLILGDNIFYGNGLTRVLSEAEKLTKGATIFTYRVKDTRSYGVVELDASGRAISIEEKPKNPRSNLAITGLYLYDENATTIAKTIEPSCRGELEISAINESYLKANSLDVVQLHRGFAWFDAGTIDDLMTAAEFVKQIQKRQGQMICCPEEISLKKRWITFAQLESTLAGQIASDYKNYLQDLINESKLASKTDN